MLLQVKSNFSIAMTKAEFKKKKTSLHQNCI